MQLSGSGNYPSPRRVSGGQPRPLGFFSLVKRCIQTLYAERVICANKEEKKRAPLALEPKFYFLAYIYWGLAQKHDFGSAFVRRGVQFQDSTAFWGISAALERCGSFSSLMLSALAVMLCSSFQVRFVIGAFQPY